MKNRPCWGGVELRVGAHTAGALEKTRSELTVGCMQFTVPVFDALVSEPSLSASGIDTLRRLARCMLRNFSAWRCRNLRAGAFSGLAAVMDAVRFVRRMRAACWADGETEAKKVGLSESQ